MTVELWVTVVLVSIADIAITNHGLQVGFVEINPVAHAGLVLFGFWSLVLLKCLALGIGAINSRILERHQYLVPTAFILVWGTAVLSNIALILAHTY